MPDTRYNSQVLQRLINRIMYSGKKSVAQNVVYTALQIAETKLQKPALSIFEEAMNKLGPNV